MLPTPNEYIRTPPYAQIKITGAAYEVVVDVDDVYVNRIDHLSWCLDTTKGEIYATDASMEVPTLLGIVSPRVYLWKYIAYLATGKICKAWRGRPQLDYRLRPDSILIIEQQADTRNIST